MLSLPEKPWRRIVDINLRFVKGYNYKTINKQIMYIFNTTYHAAGAHIDTFLEWIKKEYITRAIQSKQLSDPQLALIMAKEDGSDGNNYSLQFKVESIDILESWYKETGSSLLNEMHLKFGHQVSGFSTIMKIIEL